MKRVILAGFVALALSLAARAEAATITYDTLDLGAGQWQYSYNVNGFPAVVDQGFTIYFDETLYTALTNPTTAAPAEWDLFVGQPDLGLPAAGFFDGRFVGTNPSAGNPFTIQFTFLGLGTPGSQPFEIYNNSPFQILQSGTTQLAGVVPEPATLVLFAGGVVLAARSLRRRRRQQQSKGLP